MNHPSNPGMNHPYHTVPTLEVPILTQPYLSELTQPADIATQPFLSPLTQPPRNQHHERPSPPRVTTVRAAEREHLHQAQQDHQYHSMEQHRRHGEDRAHRHSTRDPDPHHERRGRRRGRSSRYELEDTLAHIGDIDSSTTTSTSGLSDRSVSRSRNSRQTQRSSEYHYGRLRRKFNRLNRYLTRVINDIPMVVDAQMTRTLQRRTVAISQALDTVLESHDTALINTYDNFYNTFENEVRVNVLQPMHEEYQRLLSSMIEQSGTDLQNKAALAMQQLDAKQGGLCTVTAGCPSE